MRPGPAIDVPDVLRSKARHEGAEEWLERLPTIVGSLAAKWRLDVGGVLEGGTEALIVEVTQAGIPAVLKIHVPRAEPHAHREIAVLRAVGGDGCVRLLDADEEHHALLVERLGPSMADLGLPHDERVDLLLAALGRMWRPAPALGLPTGAEKGRWLIDHITDLAERHPDACSPAVLEHALACARRRIDAHDPRRAVLVHGDVHQWNALRSGDGFTLIDPDGLVAEPEYDLGVLLREDPEEQLSGDPYRLVRRFADQTGTDATAVWEWGVVERVSTGLLCEAIGLQPVGRQMLAVADRVAGRPGP